MIPISLQPSNILPSTINMTPSLCTKAPHLKLSPDAVVSEIKAYGGFHHLQAVKIAQDDINKILAIKIKKVDKVKAASDNTKKHCSTATDIDSLKAKIESSNQDIKRFCTWGVIVYNIGTLYCSIPSPLYCIIPHLTYRHC